jgi:molybdopterin-guanine dinucleotide biosynthesis protein A
VVFADILGVVLAGGGSRRMGRDKALVAWRGTTLAHHAAAVLGRAFAEVVVAGPAALARPGLETVADRHPGRGPLAGLHAGLERGAGRAVFILACDLPFVTAAVARHLVAAAGERREGAWVAADGDGPQPLCGLYAPACREVAAHRLEAGRLDMGGFLRAVGGVAVPLTPQLPFYRPELLLNLNLPADLRRARRAERAGAGR